MLSILNYITWNVSPFIYEGEHFTIGWYGTLWTLGLIGMLVTLLLTFKHDKVPTQYALITFMISLVCVIFFGHIFHGLFYEWYYSPEAPSHYLGIEWNYRNDFLDHPWKFIDIAHGGFASHGCVAGVFVAGWICSKLLKCTYWYSTDRVMMGLFWIAIAVRIANLINNEIYGIATTLPWGFVFGDNTFASHPTQIYEIGSYVLAMTLAYWLFFKKEGGLYHGFITAVMLVTVMLLRIMIEFIKIPQMLIEDDWYLNMGQWLSIPFAIWAIWLLFYSREKGKDEHIIPSFKTTRAERRRRK